MIPDIYEKYASSAREREGIKKEGRKEQGGDNGVVMSCSFE
jgi:hypothetical protein